MLIKARVGNKEFHFDSDETPIMVILNNSEMEFFSKIFSKPEPPNRFIFYGNKIMNPEKATEWMKEKP